MDKSITQQTLSLLPADLELPEASEQLGEEEAIGLLAKAVSLLLDRDFERMLQICYRVDLSENLLKKILNESKPENVSLDLATALWERQKQKVEFRRRYS